MKTSQCARCRSTFVRRVPPPWWLWLRTLLPRDRLYECWHCGWKVWAPTGRTALSRLASFGDADRPSP